MACLGFWSAQGILAAGTGAGGKEDHKFDVPEDLKVSPRQRTQMRYSAFIDLVKTLQAELGERELIRLLNINSSALGRRVGKEQAAESSDTSFQSFVGHFRPPGYATTLTHVVTEDTETAFGLRVTECVWASVFREAGLGGEIGHAAICNMDFTWPTAFNPNISMERTHTLMQGDDHCNHRYVHAVQRERGSV
jgi:hypothetical protein